ncbi:DUF4365 domain-containing protein [Sphingopyxis sp.]|uniref:DUF4365 domain-containing protein n=1 Tax=Sphingopyxis sp. TaxID=1908224 RepID=UPI00311F8044
MSLNTQRRGQVGINIVESVILNEWKGRWQPIDAHNDDGVDGLIFLEAGGEMTGQVIFAQVKCFSGVRLDSNGRYCLSIGIKKLEKNLSRWRRLVGAAIVIYVDAATRKCFWVNARDPGAIKGSQVFVPEHQSFDARARQVVAGLCGNIHRDLLAPLVETTAEDYPHLRSKEHIQRSAKALYRQLSSEPVRIGENGPVVEFDRDGWRHITRAARPQLTRYQSFVLLGAVRKIVEISDVGTLKRHNSKQIPSAGEFVSARAAVSFPFRQTGIVKVVLKILPTDGEPRYLFHTVYEPRRRRNVMGAREPLPR